MYELDESDTDYSYEYSDLEYNTVEPYDYELNSFINYKNENETLEEKLLTYIEESDLDGVKSLLPGLLAVQEKEQHTKHCNGDINVNEEGDVPSDLSTDETSEDEENDSTDHLVQTKIKEVFLKGGITPLILAISDANVTLVEYILSIGVDPNYSEPNTNNCALLALTSHVSVDWRFSNYKWDVEGPKCLRLLIDAGVNVKVKGFLRTDESGFTALHYAARNNYWEMLIMLIQAGADLNTMSNQKETALMLAAMRGHVVCCNMLLLAGANALLTDRGGCNAAYLAGIENHGQLSDAINVFSGSAQHNVELYKMWNQYVQHEDVSNFQEQKTLEISDNLSNTCIESFCWSLNAPYLITIMQDQGITISDLKLMSFSKLNEIGVPNEDCDKILNAMQDFDRKGCRNKTRISFEYGNPLKIVTMLEMMGNTSEHVELLETNLECWHSHLSKKYQTNMVLHKSTISKLQCGAQTCMQRTKSFIEQLQELREICTKISDDNTLPTSQVNGGQLILPSNNNVALNKRMSLSRLSLMSVSLVAVAISVAWVFRRLI